MTRVPTLHHNIQEPPFLVTFLHMHHVCLYYQPCWHMQSPPVLLPRLLSSRDDMHTHCSQQILSLQESHYFVCSTDTHLLCYSLSQHWASSRQQGSLLPRSQTDSVCDLGSSAPCVGRWHWATNLTRYSAQDNMYLLCMHYYLALYL